MTDQQMLRGCGCCAMNRRQFLASGCAACAGAGAVWHAATPARAVEATAPLRIHVIYSLHAPEQPRPDWPNVGFDFQPVMDRFNTQLREGCPGFEFTFTQAAGEEQAKEILEKDAKGRIDGYVVFQMNCWNRVVQTIASSGKPTLYADFQYGGSGGFLVYTAAFLRSKSPNVGFVASSRMGDLIAAVRCFEVVRNGGGIEAFVAATAAVRQKRTPEPGDAKCKEDGVTALSPGECLARLKASRILVFEEGWPNIHDAITREMGIPVVKCPFKELNAAWESADKDASEAIARRWQASARKVTDVSVETLQKSAAMYLAMKQILEKHEANAITINCLGGFYGNHIQAYPCLGFHELLNEGLIGACESDVRSTATMVAMSAMTGGRTGFISDPVLDTSSRRIIYAHCVAMSRAFGPKGEANPFEIMTHSEDRQGASVRSLLPVGYMTTTVEFAPERKTILFHQGRSVANVNDDRACRTKLAVEPVGDFEKLFAEWDQWGWHRVTVYGDLKEPVYALADALGWNVLAEA